MWAIEAHSELMSALNRRFLMKEVDYLLKELRTLPECDSYRGAYCIAARGCHKSLITGFLYSAAVSIDSASFEPYPFSNRTYH